MKQVSLKFSHKATDLDEHYFQINNPDHPSRVEPAIIIKSVKLDMASYDEFSNCLIGQDYDWMNGLGGEGVSGKKVIEVYAENRHSLFINPEGYSYARETGTRG